MLGHAHLAPQRPSQLEVGECRISATEPLAATVTFPELVAG